MVMIKGVTPSADPKNDMGLGVQGQSTYIPFELNIAAAKSLDKTTVAASGNGNSNTGKQTTSSVKAGESLGYILYNALIDDHGHIKTTISVQDIAAIGQQLGLPTDIINTYLQPLFDQLVARKAQGLSDVECLQLFKNDLTNLMSNVAFTATLTPANTVALNQLIGFVDTMIVAAQPEGGIASPVSVINENQDIKAMIAAMPGLTSEQKAALMQQIAALISAGADPEKIKALISAFIKQGGTPTELGALLSSLQLLITADPVTLNAIIDQLTAVITSAKPENLATLLEMVSQLVVACKDNPAVLITILTSINALLGAGVDAVKLVGLMSAFIKQGGTPTELAALLSSIQSVASADPVTFNAIIDQLTTLITIAKPEDLAALLKMVSQLVIACKDNPVALLTALTSVNALLIAGVDLVKVATLINALIEKGATPTQLCELLSSIQALATANPTAVNALMDTLILMISATSIADLTQVLTQLQTLLTSLTGLTGEPLAKALMQLSTLSAVDFKKIITLMIDLSPADQKQLATVLSHDLGNQVAAIITLVVASFETLELPVFSSLLEKLATVSPEFLPTITGVSAFLSQSLTTTPLDPKTIVNSFIAIIDCAITSKDQAAFFSQVYPCLAAIGQTQLGTVDTAIMREVFQSILDAHITYTDDEKKRIMDSFEHMLETLDNVASDITPIVIQQIFLRLADPVISAEKSIEIINFFQKVGIGELPIANLLEEMPKVFGSLNGNSDEIQAVIRSQGLTNNTDVRIALLVAVTFVNNLVPNMVSAAVSTSLLPLLNEQPVVASFIKQITPYFTNTNLAVAAHIMTVQNTLLLDAQQALLAIPLDSIAELTKQAKAVASPEPPKATKTNGTTQAVTEFLKPNDPKVQTIIAKIKAQYPNWDSMSDDEKAVAIYQFLQSHIRYKKDDTDTWKECSESINGDLNSDDWTIMGDCEDICIAVASVMLGAGISPDKVKISMVPVDGNNLHAFINYDGHMLDVGSDQGVQPLNSSSAAGLDELPVVPTNVVFSFGQNGVEYDPTSPSPAVSASTVFGQNVHTAGYSPTGGFTGKTWTLDDLNNPDSQFTPENVFGGPPTPRTFVIKGFFASSFNFMTAMCNVMDLQQYNAWKAVFQYLNQGLSMETITKLMKEIFNSTTISAEDKVKLLNLLSSGQNAGYVIYALCYPSAFTQRNGAIPTADAALASAKNGDFSGIYTIMNRGSQSEIDALIAAAPGYDITIDKNTGTVNVYPYMNPYGDSGDYKPLTEREVLHTGNYKSSDAVAANPKDNNYGIPSEWFTTPPVGLREILLKYLATFPGVVARASIMLGQATADISAGIDITADIFDKDSIGIRSLYAQFKEKYTVTYWMKQGLSQEEAYQRAYNELKTYLAGSVTIVSSWLAGDDQHTEWSYYSGTHLTSAQQKQLLDQWIACNPQTKSGEQTWFAVHPDGSYGANFMTLTGDDLTTAMLPIQQAFLMMTLITIIMNALSKIRETVNELLGITSGQNSTEIMDLDVITAMGSRFINLPVQALEETVDLISKINDNAYTTKLAAATAENEAKGGNCLSKIGDALSGNKEAAEKQVQFAMEQLRITMGYENATTATKNTMARVLATFIEQIKSSSDPLDQQIAELYQEALQHNWRKAAGDNDRLDFDKTYAMQLTERVHQASGSYSAKVMVEMNNDDLGSMVISILLGVSIGSNSRQGIMQLYGTIGQVRDAIFQMYMNSEQMDIKLHNAVIDAMDALESAERLLSATSSAGGNLLMAFVIAVVAVLSVFVPIALALGVALMNMYLIAAVAIAIISLTLSLATTFNQRDQLKAQIDNLNHPDNFSPTAISEEWLMSQIEEARNAAANSRDATVKAINAAIAKMWEEIAKIRKMHNDEDGGLWSTDMDGVSKIESQIKALEYMMMAIMMIMEALNEMRRMIIQAFTGVSMGSSIGITTINELIAGQLSVLKTAITYEVQTLKDVVAEHNKQREQEIQLHQAQESLSGTVLKIIVSVVQAMITAVAAIINPALGLALAIVSAALSIWMAYRDFLIAKEAYELVDDVNLRSAVQGLIHDPEEIPPEQDQRPSAIKAIDQLTRKLHDAVNRMNVNNATMNIGNNMLALNGAVVLQGTQEMKQAYFTLLALLMTLKTLEDMKDIVINGTSEVRIQSWSQSMNKALGVELQFTMTGFENRLSQIEEEIQALNRKERAKQAMDEALRGLIKSVIMSIVNIILQVIALKLPKADVAEFQKIASLINSSLRIANQLDNVIRAQDKAKDDFGDIEKVQKQMLQLIEELFQEDDHDPLMKLIVEAIKNMNTGLVQGIGQGKIALNSGYMAAIQAKIEEVFKLIETKIDMLKFIADIRDMVSSMTGGYSLGNNFDMVVQAVKMQRQVASIAVGQLHQLVSTYVSRYNEIMDAKKAFYSALVSFLVALAFDVYAQLESFGIIEGFGVKLDKKDQATLTEWNNTGTLATNLANNTNNIANTVRSLTLLNNMLEKVTKMVVDYLADKLADAIYESQCKNPKPSGLQPSVAPTAKFTANSIKTFSAINAGNTDIIKKIAELRHAQEKQDFEEWFSRLKTALDDTRSIVQNAASIEEGYVRNPEAKPGELKAMPNKALVAAATALMNQQTPISILTDPKNTSSSNSEKSKSVAPEKSQSKQPSEPDKQAPAAAPAAPATQPTAAAAPPPPSPALASSTSSRTYTEQRTDSVDPTVIKTSAVLPNASQFSPLVPSAASTLVSNSVGSIESFAKVMASNITQLTAVEVQTMAKNQINMPQTIDFFQSAAFAMSTACTAALQSGTAEIVFAKDAAYAKVGNVFVNAKNQTGISQLSTAVIAKITVICDPTSKKFSTTTTLATKAETKAKANTTTTKTSTAKTSADTTMTEATTTASASMSAAKSSISAAVTVADNTTEIVSSVVVAVSKLDAQQIKSLQTQLEKLAVAPAQTKPDQEKNNSQSKQQPKEETDSADINKSTAVPITKQELASALPTTPTQPTTTLVTPASNVVTSANISDTQDPAVDKIIKEIQKQLPTREPIDIAIIISAILQAVAPQPTTTASPTTASTIITASTMSVVQAVAAVMPIPIDIAKASTTIASFTNKEATLEKAVISLQTPQNKQLLSNPQSAQTMIQELTQQVMTSTSSVPNDPAVEKMVTAFLESTLKAASNNQPVNVADVMDVLREAQLQLTDNVASQNPAQEKAVVADIRTPEELQQIVEKAQQIVEQHKQIAAVIQTVVKRVVDERQSMAAAVIQLQEKIQKIEQNDQELTHVSEKQNIVETRQKQAVVLKETAQEIDQELTSYQQKLTDDQSLAKRLIAAEQTINEIISEQQSMLESSKLVTQAAQSTVTVQSVSQNENVKAVAVAAIQIENLAAREQVMSPNEVPMVDQQANTMSVGKEVIDGLAKNDKANLENQNPAKKDPTAPKVLQAAQRLKAAAEKTDETVVEHSRDLKEQPTQQLLKTQTQAMVKELKNILLLIVAKPTDDAAPVSATSQALLSELKPLAKLLSSLKEESTPEQEMNVLTDVIKKMNQQQLISRGTHPQLTKPVKQQLELLMKDIQATLQAATENTQTSQEFSEKMETILKKIKTAKSKDEVIKIIQDVRANHPKTIAKMAQYMAGVVKSSLNNRQQTESQQPESLLMPSLEVLSVLTNKAALDTIINPSKDQSVVQQMQTETLQKQIKKMTEPIAKELKRMSTQQPKVITELLEKTTAKPWLHAMLIAFSDSNRSDTSQKKQLPEAIIQQDTFPAIVPLTRSSVQALPVPKEKPIAVIMKEAINDSTQSVYETVTTITALIEPLPIETIIQLMHDMDDESKKPIQTPDDFMKATKMTNLIVAVSQKSADIEKKLRPDFFALSVQFKEMLRTFKTQNYESSYQEVLEQLPHTMLTATFSLIKQQDPLLTDSVKKNVTGELLTLFQNAKLPIPIEKNELLTATVTSQSSDINNAIDETIQTQLNAQATVADIQKAVLKVHRETQKLQQSLTQSSETLSPAALSTVVQGIYQQLKKIKTTVSTIAQIGDQEQIQSNIDQAMVQLNQLDKLEQMFARYDYLTAKISQLSTQGQDVTNEFQTLCKENAAFIPYLQTFVRNEARLDKDKQKQFQEILEKMAVTQRHSSSASTLQTYFASITTMSQDMMNELFQQRAKERQKNRREKESKRGKNPDIKLKSFTLALDTKARSFGKNNLAMQQQQQQPNRIEQI